MSNLDKIGELEEIAEGRGQDRKNFLQALQKPNPYLLVHPSGDVYDLAESAKILSTEMESDDLVIVGPHGEIVPFIAKCLRQKLIEVSESNEIVHLDAHYDNQDHSFPHESQKTAQAIKAYLEAKTEDDAKKHFETLINHSSNDFETFLNALKVQFPFISAIIRPEGTSNLEIFDHHQAPYNQYGEGKVFPEIFQNRANLDKKAKIQVLANVIKSAEKRHGGIVYSIDADFCGVKSEWEVQIAQAKDTLFTETSETLVGALRAGIAKTANNSKERIFTLSIDPQYCHRATDFTMNFLTNFYLPHIRK